MQVTLFMALKSANIADDAAEKVVHAFEEHIDMAISEAMKHYEDRISAMQTVIEAKLDTGFKQIDARIAGLDAKFNGLDGKFEGRFAGMQTSIDILKWALVTQATLLVIGGAVISAVKLLT